MNRRDEPKRPAPAGRRHDRAEPDDEQRPVGHPDADAPLSARLHEINERSTDSRWSW